MTDNVGLSTPRGSGTSGYVQRNLAHLKPRDRAAPYPPPSASRDFHRQRQPDKGILEHERKREVEVKVMELRDQLEDEGLEDDAIDDRCDALRKDLLSELENPRQNNNNRRRDGGGGPSRGSNRGGPPPDPRRDARNLKMHQVHELADAKIKQDDRFRKALKISKDYEEGSHWRRQEDRMKKAVEREQREEEEDRERDGGRDRDRSRDGARGEDREEGEVRGYGDDYDSGFDGGRRGRD